MSLYEAALDLSPADPEFYIDYARLSFNLMQYSRAKTSAEKAVQLDPQNAQARLLFGQVLYQLGDYQASQVELQSVFATNPDVNVGYLLGTNYLLAGDPKVARALFDQMLRKWGNTPFNHTLIGRAYSQTGHPDEAFAEFHKAMEIDSTALQVHYQLGLAYLLRNEATGYDDATREFRAELKLNPKDFSSYYTLGYIAVERREWPLAEKELLQASALDPNDRQTLLELAETYVATNRPAEAEATLRRTLEIGKDLPPDHWTERAHYLLAHVLLSEPGHADEAKEHLKIVSSIQKQLGPAGGQFSDDREAGAASRGRKEGPLSPTDSASNGVDANQRQLLQDFVQRISLPIANAYNNLGVAAADQHDFAGAVKYLSNAKQWNPAHQGLDRNLGMAAFYANQFREAIDPLRAHLQAQPADVAARAALGFSLFNIQDFQGTVETLRPMQDQMTATPKLAYAYAAALARSGNYDEGIDRLKTLEEANPSAPDVHHELALAYEHQGRTEDAAKEMKIYDDSRTQTPGTQTTRPK